MGCGCSCGPDQMPGPAMDSHQDFATHTERKSIFYLVHVSVPVFPPVLAHQAVRIGRTHWVRPHVLACPPTPKSSDTSSSRPGHGPKNQARAAGMK
eukprot:6490612-Amphidinium_carterae.2